MSPALPLMRANKMRMLAAKRLLAAMLSVTLTRYLSSMLPPT